MKETLNLGKTKFPMRGNLPVKEVERQKVWDEENLYGKVLAKHKDQKPFVLHDGPPYANGNIHIGHAMNKISKDIIVRSKAMEGYYAPYIPGWDTHGLPIEQAVTNSGIDRKSMTLMEFRDLCRRYAEEQVASQKADFRRLGVLGDWDHPYLTFKPNYEAAQLRLFSRMVEEGLIYRGKRPVYWSPSSESTLAEAEIEYQDVEATSAFYAERILDGKGKLSSEVEAIVWTTTPWTVPSSQGITVNKDFDYVVVGVNGHHYLVSQVRLELLKGLFGWEDLEIEQTLKGSDLEYMTASHPFYDRELLFMLGDFVTTDAGTGLVHTAPGFGEDDFNVSTSYGLEVLSPMDDQGRLTKELPGFEGMFYEEANEKVLNLLEEKGALLKKETFVHSYPHDWRTKKPVVYRATAQWFCSVEKIRERSLEAIEKEVVWHHPSGQRRIYNMIRDRGDWVISRQRVWGVPLPIFYNEDGSAILDPEVINHVADLVQENGTNIWFEKEAKDLLPDGYHNPASPNNHFTKETDIMDVWFDSGSSHVGVLEEREELSAPADLYLEGSDQYRGWFNSSLLASIAYRNQAPYKEVVSQGFVNDGEGRKMSKSLGNTISPNDVATSRGVEILRLWVANVDTRYDVRISDDILGQVSEAYRKIRNTLRYMLSNLYDFNKETDAISYEHLDEVDQYILVLLDEMTQKVEDAYDQYDFNTVYHEIFNFLSVTMSSFYLDYAKDVLYIEYKEDPKRRNMQTVISFVLESIVRLLTPILPHTMEEIWEYLDEEEAFAQLSSFPTVQQFENAEELKQNFEKFETVRSEVNRSLENARNEKVIGKSLEARVHLTVGSEFYDFLEKLGEKLRVYLIVSQLELSKANDEESIKVEVSHALGDTCERCRGTYESVGTIPEAPSLCERCARIVLTYYPEVLENKD